MIFQHTLEDVLSGRKTATTRLWKSNYKWCFDENHRVNETDSFHPKNIIVKSHNSGRTLYYVGQKLSVQPGRGKKGVAKIEITRLTKVMIHHVIEDESFIAIEGFSNKAEFLKVWRQMHGMAQMGLHIQFKLI